MIHGFEWLCQLIICNNIMNYKRDNSKWLRVSAETNCTALYGKLYECVGNLERENVIE